jgi:hypothetical protein
MMKLNKRYALIATCAVTFLAFSCGPTDDPDGGDSVNPNVDTVGANTGLKINGQSFMMPSPTMIADLIKKSGALYDKNMLNPTTGMSNYSDATKRALNLGVYGADLGYVTMYENTGDALEYYKAVVQLGEQLKITGSFDPSLMKRFSENLGKKDSLLSLVGEAYRRSDQFLRESEQENTAAMILAGGWVESIYFALNVYKQKEDKPMSIRIGEQKSTAAGIVKMLQALQTEENPHAEYNDLIKLFQDLNAEYQKVEIKYTFAEPTHDELHHVTSINGNTEVKITPEQLNALLEKVTAIRNYITK